MNFKEIINLIKPFKTDQYSHIKSDSKLGASTAFYLYEKGVPLTMNYLGIAMFKMFPDRFYCDEDFREYPSLDRLNREICMHMTITKKKTDAILSGSAKKGFVLTSFGKYIGNETLQSIENGNQNISTKVVSTPIDSHKQSPHSEYNKIITSKMFIAFDKNNQFNGNLIWALYEVIPFTQVSLIKAKLKLAEITAKEKGDKRAINFINQAINHI
jgi:hypothetical protein